MKGSIAIIAMIHVLMVLIIFTYGQPVNGGTDVGQNISISNSMYSTDERIPVVFRPWVGSVSNSNLSLQQNGFFHSINGTSIDSSGFVTDLPLNYTGRYVILSLGEVNKSSVTDRSKDTQVSFILNLMGIEDKYQLVLVNGPLAKTGASNDHIIREHIYDESSHIIDLQQIISGLGDRLDHLDSIGINIQNNSEIAQFQFRIDLLNSY